jgi:ABC-type dipeptide/oligopeptide/nickel transport system permease component
MLVLAVALGWLPVSGTGSAAHLVLPAVTLGLGLAAVVGRMGAATLAEVLDTPMVRTAAAKGASPWRQGWHAARNAALPMVQAGRLRAIAQTGLKRSPQLPDLPTVAEFREQLEAIRNRLRR